MGSTQHLVRGSDLNHHESLYAGRGADWLIETAYITASEILRTDSVVVLKANELHYITPVRLGEILRIEGKAVYAGRSSLIVYVHGTVHNKKALEAFITFVHVDQDGHPVPHGFVLESVAAENDE